MSAANSHIVSGLNWQTSFDRKESASSLQEQLSHWTRTVLHKEMAEIFDKLCPPEQTWRIRSLDLDLGPIDYNELETELPQRIRSVLTARLIDLIIYGNRDTNNDLEILSGETSQLAILQTFLLQGLMPWNHHVANGTAEEVMALQLQENRQELLAMIRTIGAAQEVVRKRLVWQFSERNIRRIIEGLEPNNHTEIFNFTDELVLVQEKTHPVQAGTSELKKNVWHWVFNFLLTERGTIFNRIAFLKSTIRQMAAHYNVRYETLLAMIEEAVTKITAHTVVEPEFIRTLKLLTQEEQQLIRDEKPQQEAAPDYWERLATLLLDGTSRQVSGAKTALNSLVPDLSANDAPRFSKIISEAMQDAANWSQVLSELSEFSRESILEALAPAPAPTELKANILLLEKITVALRLRIERRLLWEIVLGFVHHQEGSFSTRQFWSYCFEALSRHTHIPKTALLLQTITAGIPSEIKSVIAPENYSELVELLVTELPSMNRLIGHHAVGVVRRLAKQLRLSSAGREVSVSLRRRLAQAVHLYPREVFAAIAALPDEQALDRLLLALPEQESIAALRTEAAQLLGTLLTALRKKQISLPQERALSWLEEAIRQTGWRILVYSPQLQKEEFITQLAETIFSMASSPETEQFVALLEKTITDKQLRSFSRRIDFARLAKAAKDKLQALPIEEQALLLISEKAGPAKVALLLQARFNDNKFIALRKSQSKNATRLLHYLAPGSEQQLASLLRKYVPALAAGLRQSEAGVRELLIDLYWKAALQFDRHRGRTENILRSFSAAVRLRFSSLSSTLSVLHELEERSSAAVLRLENGMKLSVAQTIALLETVFETRAEQISISGKPVSVATLITASLTTKPALLRQALARTHTPQVALQLLKSTMSFRRFSLLILADQHGEQQSVLEAMRLLSDLVAELAPAALATKLIDLYWETSVQLIRSGSWNLKKLIHDSFTLLAKGINLGADLVLLEMKKRNIPMTTVLRKNLIAAYPAFEAIGSPERSNDHSELLARFEAQDLLEELAHSLVLHLQLPAGTAEAFSEDPAVLLKALLVYHPEKILRILQDERPSTPQLRKLLEHAGISAFLRAITYLHPERQSQLGILEEFYEALGRISVRGVAAAELQFLLFEKIMRTWTRSNWKTLSVEMIWHELLWELTSRRNITREKILQDFERSKTLLPPALQLSFGAFADKVAPKKTTALPPENKPSRPAIKTSEPVSTARGGIAVRNAGMVLLSTYYPMLLDRLKLTAAKKFVSTTAQTEAVHYLQYVVTGLTRTEESLLPLNKLLCGLSLSLPVMDGIDLTEEQKMLIDGLIKAAISHWPAIGETSINGFRGNWLVRDGLLVETPERWELTVEKKAYDVLLHKSPYSFSITKYPWMEKPLHVTWNY